MIKRWINNYKYKVIVDFLYWYFGEDAHPNDVHSQASKYLMYKNKQ